MRLRTILPALSLVFLAACGAGGSMLSFTYTVDSQEGTRKTDLASASARVFERRLLGLDQEVQRGDVTVDGDTLDVKVKGKDVAEALLHQMAQPFFMEIMVEAEATKADISHPELGSFQKTGIEKQHFDWVSVQSSVQPGKMAAHISFTPEGQKLLKDVFSQNQGKKIGIFLRGNLMSQKLIGPTDTQGRITVDGIPGTELASVFADDVNVGLHVTFAEVK